VSVDGLATGLLWGIAALLVLAVVGCVVVHRLAARVLIGAVAVLLALGAFAARQQVGAIPGEHLSELCTGGVRWFGIDLVGSDAQCAGWR
jgi:hypothetical protein